MKKLTIITGVLKTELILNVSPKYGYSFSKQIKELLILKKLFKKKPANPINEQIKVDRIIVSVILSRFFIFIILFKIKYTSNK